ncbi:Plasmid maintenance system antidote protein [Mannheimia haemolytica]|nr:Plasmid maintenance system antidote protein [Mannheimia haemolytica]
MTANLALSLEEAGISTAKLWLNLQTKYDLWELKQQRLNPVMPFHFGGNYGETAHA